MKSNALKGTVRSIVVLASAAALGGGLTQAVAGALPTPPRHLGGLLNDYSPAHVNGTAVKGAPYEMRGQMVVGPAAVSPAPPPSRPHEHGNNGRRRRQPRRSDDPAVPTRITSR
jgi:hypothetical protein